MWFRIFLLVCNLLVPITMLGFGLYFEKHAPKKINYTFGYRTNRSMKNQDTWQFAHHYCGRLWKWLGCTLLAVTLLFTVITWNWDDIRFSYACCILLFIQLVIFVGSIFPTEKALKKTFDVYGRRR